MKRLILAVPHSHSWLFTQTCLSALKRFPPVADGIEARIVVVDNSWDWSPSIRGITDTRLGEGVCVVQNPKPNKFHASALDTVVEQFDFDYLLAFETDVMPLRDDWLSWFLSQLRETDYAVGHWHHEQFVNPSCTLYRGEVLRQMNAWCKANTSVEMHWGDNFQLVENLKEEYLPWIAGPFADKRGWPQGTRLRERPSGQEKGSGWYEPGQMLHHWAVEQGYSYTVCPTTTTDRQPGMPIQTFYGWTEGGAPEHQLEAHDMWGKAASVHLWAGTRSLDIIKHGVDQDEFVKQHTEFWQQREARFWLNVVPEDVREQTIGLIHEYGWHTKGAGTPEVTDRDRAAAAGVMENYRRAGMPI